MTTPGPPPPAPRFPRNLLNPDVRNEVVGGLIVAAIVAAPGAIWGGAVLMNDDGPTPPTTTASSSPPPDSPGPGQTFPETTGGETNTWTDYSNAGGERGEVIASQTTVAVRCRVDGFAVEDGNTWWYRIASEPWNDEFYASADAFYNNGERSGGLDGTPFVDEDVPLC